MLEYVQDFLLDYWAVNVKECVHRGYICLNAESHAQIFLPIVGSEEKKISHVIFLMYGKFKAPKAKEEVAVMARYTPSLSTRVENLIAGRSTLKSSHLPVTVCSVLITGKIHLKLRV